MRQAVVSALGRDRPGIVAAITEVLLAHGCNIADSHMGLLSGRFSMMLIVSAPDDVDEQPFLDALAEAAAAVGLETIEAHWVGEGEALAATEPTHLVTVYGADHPGIVNAVARALADAGANITGLDTRLAGELYVMTLEVSGGGDLEATLAGAATDAAVQVSVRPLDTDVL